MKIFPNEANIAGLILNNRSLSYCVNLEHAPQLVNSKAINKFAQAKNYDSNDLYPVTSVLASTSLNKNDDIFLRTEMWKARHTAKHHPTNIGHNETEIVGHITDIVPVDWEGNVLADDLDPESLPNFDLVDYSVIYTAWRDEDKLDEVLELINAIEEGKMAVSMECMFSDFDYAISADNGTNITIVPRNEETSILTRFLKVYGGSGSFEGNRVYRVFKNLQFVGKGYTPEPANERSTIFLKNNDNISFIMEDSVISSIASVNKTTETEMDTQVETVSVEDFEAQKALVASLENEKVSLTTTLAEKDEAIKSLELNIENLKAEKDGVTADLTSLASQKETLVTELATSQEALKIYKREVSLMLSGVDKAEASEKVKLFANLSDTQWNSVAEALIKIKTPEPVKSEVEPEVEVINSAVASTPVTPSVTPEPAPAITRAQMQEALGEMLKIKKTK